MEGKGRGGDQTTMSKENKERCEARSQKYCEDVRNKVGEREMGEEGTQSRPNELKSNQKKKKRKSVDTPARWNYSS